MKKNLSILLLLLFGILYSLYLAFEGGIFLGLITALMTIGLSTTIYILYKRINYKLIVYIWVGIVTIAVIGFISIGVFQMIDFFRSPLKFI